MVYLTGFHAIKERIKVCATDCALFVAKPGPRAREIVSLATKSGITVIRKGISELDRVSPGHRGIALEISGADQSAEVTLDSFLENLDGKENVLAVVMDEITDPHNFGAILRSCDQFNADIVITRNRRTARNADIVAKTSAGASAWVRSVCVANLPRAVERLKEEGFWIYGADMKGTPVYKSELRGRVCIILGGEGAGLSRLLKERCDALVSVPSFGRVDSLNVSVAAGVIMYEVMRQRADDAPAR
ncbi:MAG: 23S rRNA (guanosine(2251)-2'-O)-methyltransferase RlmB [Spirochaetaceae bacterium]|nr:23S rRNA (guanosine(2251)-2'-O)-methyltransferase RlmB [Spirochaetaceae bacterium]